MDLFINLYHGRLSVHKQHKRKLNPAGHSAKNISPIYLPNPVIISD
jgi:hypothetical protein